MYFIVLLLCIFLGFCGFCVSSDCHFMDIKVKVMAETV